MKKNIVLDFDGVIHMYVTPWREAGIIPDGPVPGALDFIVDLVMNGYRVHIFSSRSHQPGGLRAMQEWLHDNFVRFGYATEILEEIQWPTEKVPAHLSIDDRGITFSGEFPSLDYIANFKPWNRASK